MKTKTSHALKLAATLWLSVVVGLMALLLRFSNSPGSGGGCPAQWPAASQVPLDPRRPTLVMFAHPRCPCTRASLGELEVLLARCQGRFSVHLLFFKPAGTAEIWAQTSLWRRACSVPGVMVHSDNAGAEARRFHSETSGQTVVYAPDGRLLFQGGITISRGHSGDNPGRNALCSLLDKPSSRQIQAPVFGCALFESGAKAGSVVCKQK